MCSVVSGLSQAKELRNMFTDIHEKLFQQVAKSTTIEDVSMACNVRPESGNPC